MKQFACILRILTGGVFITAGAFKVRDPASFALDIDHFHLLPYFAVAPLALYLPWLEILCGLAALLGPARRGALWVMLILTVIFTGALTSAWMRGLDINCGCFGHASAGPLWQDLVRDLILCGILIWLLRGEKNSPAASAK